MKLREAVKRREEINRIRLRPTLDASAKSIELATAKGQEYMLFGSVLRQVRDDLREVDRDRRLEGLLKLVEVALGPNWQ